MAEVFSPQVITREIDVSTVAPRVSSSIAAIVGGAVKGPVNDPQFITTPDQFVEVFGEPTPLSYLGYTAINYLRQGNQLWVNRIASEDGADPVASANTDTRPSVTSNVAFVTGVTGSITVAIDTTSVVVNFSPVTSASISDIAATIDTALAVSEPRLGYTSVSGSTITIWGQSKDSRSSSVVITNVVAVGGFSIGQQSSSLRTVQTAEALSAAALTSVNAGATIDTTVTYAGIQGDTDADTTLYNVSKVAQEAYGTMTVENAAFVDGTYNSGVLKFLAQPTTETLTLSDVAGGGGSLAIIFGTNVTVPGTWDADDQDSLMSDLADYINDTVASTSQWPDAGVRAEVTATSVAGGLGAAAITLTQIHPDASTPATVFASAATTWELDTVDASSAQSLSGGTTGSYFTVLVPASYADDGSALEETDITYAFMAGADWVVPVGGDLTTIASNIANAIDSFGGYWASLEYNLSASNSGNIVTITTNPVGSAGSTGNDIVVTTATIMPSGSVTMDLNGTNLYHGFDARPTYSFATFEVDGVSNTIDFDVDISAVIMPSKHEATSAQIVAAINSVFGINVASVIIPSASNEAIVVSSPVSGTEGEVTGTASANIASENDPFDTTTSVNGAVTASPVTDNGTGDNHIIIRIDETYDVDVYLSQSATQTMAQIATDINDAANDVDSSLANIATVVSDKVVITSPTLGDWTDFGSRVYITNGIPGFFADASFNDGDGSKLETITITASTPGSWANDVITIAFQDEDPLFSAPNSSRMDVLFNGVIVESFREVVINPDADGTTGSAGQGVYIENAVNEVSDYVTVDFDDDLLDLDADTLGDSVKIVENTSTLGSNPPYEVTGGADGLEGISSADVIGIVDSLGNESGLQVYADVEKIFVNLIAAPGFTDQAVGNALVTLAEGREDTLAVLDPPMGLSASDVVDWHNGLGSGRTAALNTSYAATYNTWLEQYDPYNDININLPPSSLLLAQFAYSDSVSEAWFATAGLTRGRLTSALDVLSESSLGERELMYGQGNRVNPIPKFVQEGIVIWGNRTLYRQESALKEITVRRLLNYAKTVISLGSKVIIFEPSDPTTVTRLIEIINPVLYNIKVRRGLTDFKIVNATTDNDINLNRLVIRIFLQPTRTVEVIDIPFIITAQGGSFAI